MKRSSFIAIAILFVIIPTAAFAQTHSRCECEYDDWIGDCIATIEQQGKWVRIKSDTLQCSRVDWYANGNPYITVVTDGVETQELLGFQDEEITLAIQSCKICKDAMQSQLQPGQAIGDTQQQQTFRGANLNGRWCLSKNVSSWSEWSFSSPESVTISSSALGTKTYRVTWKSDTKFKLHAGTGETYEVINANTLKRKAIMGMGGFSYVRCN